MVSDTLGPSCDSLMAATSTHTNQLLISSSSSSTITIVNFPTSLKLTNSTYISWRLQVEAILDGLSLRPYIDGSVVVPPSTITKDEVTSPNPDYDVWFRQDRLLYGALIGTISPPLIALISTAKTTHDAWQTLASTFANPSRGHIKQLQYRLRHTSKLSNQSITEYIHSIKSIIDELALLGKPVEHEDITDAILAGLDPLDYKPVIDGINARDSPITLPELHEKLIHHELILAHKNQATTLTSPASAYAANTRPHNTSSSRPNTYSKSNTPLPFTRNTQGLLPTPSTPSSSNFKGSCQWCREKGHYLSQCPKFKAHYPNTTFPTASRAQHTTTRPPRANTATKLPALSRDWLLDSGASHHITSDLNALSLHAPYDGTDDLLIGDDDSKNESEAEAAKDPCAAVSEVDDTETEHDILASFGTEHDTPIYTEELDRSNSGSNMSMFSEDRKSDIVLVEHNDRAHSVDDFVEDEIQDNGNAKYDNNQGSSSEDCRDEVDETTDDLASIQIEIGENEQGLQLISEVDDETKKDTKVCSYQVHHEANNEVENKEIGNSFNQESPVILAPRKTMTDQRSPLPLPRHPIVLKHVPTIVRRTYDSDLQKLDAIDGTHSEDGKSDGDGAEDDNLVHFVDDYLEDNIQDSGFAKSDDDQDGCKTKFGEAKDEVGSYVDASAQNEVMADEQDLELQYSSSEGDHESEDADAFTYHEDGANDDVESKDIGISDNQERTVIQAPNEEMNECPSPLLFLRHPIALKHVPTIVVRRYDPDLKYVLPIKDYKTKGDGAHEDSKHSAAAIDLDDSTSDVTPTEYDTLTNLDRKLDSGMYPEDSSNAEDDGVEGVNLASSVDTSIENRQDNGHVTYENNQGLVFEDLEHSESKSDEANEDSKTATAVNDVDVNVENGVKDIQSNDLDGFDLKDCKSQQNGAEGENISGNQYARVNLKVVDKRLGNHCNENEEFSPEAYKETLERDGYELCCPNCKCSITETMIFRRRQSSECPKTTCFSCLIPLFNWIRW